MVRTRMGNLEFRIDTGAGVNFIAQLYTTQVPAGHD